MNFTFPKKRIKDRVWFLTEQDVLKHGVIDMISMNISEHEVNVYYGVAVPTEDEQTQDYYTMSEDQIMDIDPVLPNPKWHIGDQVKFSWFNKKEEKTFYDIGRIEHIEIYISDPKKIEVGYYMEEDPNYMVMEDEIINFAETVIEPLAHETEELEATPI